MIGSRSDEGDRTAIELSDFAFDRRARHDFAATGRADCSGPRVAVDTVYRRAGEQHHLCLIRKPVAPENEFTPYPTGHAIPISPCENGKDLVYRCIEKRIRLMTKTVTPVLRNRRCSERQKN